MGFSFGGLIQGALPVATGYYRGQAGANQLRRQYANEDADRERRMRLDALQEMLLKGQVDNFAADNARQDLSQQIGAKAGAESRGLDQQRMTQAAELDRQRMAQAAEQAALDRQNRLDAARIGATSRENVAGIGATAKMGPDGTGKTLPTGAVDQLFELQSILRTAKGGANDFRTHPEAFGPQNRIPFYDLIPGTGSQHRINMGNLVSLIGKARSGGAITPQEFQRLERFLPNPGSLDEKNEKAIPLLLQELEAIIRDRQNYYRQQGYAVPGDASAGIARPAAPTTPDPAMNEGDPVDAAYQRWLQKNGQ